MEQHKFKPCDRPAERCNWANPELCHQAYFYTCGKLASDPIHTPSAEPTPLEREIANSVERHSPMLRDGVTPNRQAKMVEPQASQQSMWDMIDALTYANGQIFTLMRERDEALAAKETASDYAQGFMVKSEQYAKERDEARQLAEKLERENHSLYSHLAECDIGFGGWFSSLGDIQNLIEQGKPEEALKLIKSLFADDCPIDHERAKSKTVQERDEARQLLECSRTSLELAWQQFDSTAEQLAAEEASHMQTLTERDRTIEAADRLAYAIGTVEEIGEHSNCNDPWVQAHILLLDKLKQLAEAQAAIKFFGKTTSFFRGTNFVSISIEAYDALMKAGEKL